MKPRAMIPAPGAPAATLALALAFALALAGCSLAPTYERPAVDLPASFGPGAAPQPADAASDAPAAHREEVDRSRELVLDDAEDVGVDAVGEHDRRFREHRLEREHGVTERSHECLIVGDRHHGDALLGQFPDKSDELGERRRPVPAVERQSHTARLRGGPDDRTPVPEK